MSRNSLHIGILSAFAGGAMMLSMASSAQASIVFDTNLADPGVYYGSGSDYSPQHFAVNTQGGVEIALRSHVYQQPATTPTDNTYFIPLGQVFSFDFSVNPGGVDFTNVFASLTVTNQANGATVSFNPSLIPDNAHSLSAPGGYQNSERINFGFLGQGYDPNLNDTFNIDLTLTGVPNVGTMSISNIVQVGSGFAVPEPATWAMMILGLGFVGETLRRARRTPALATA